MVGLAFEKHDAAANTVDPGNNHDPAMKLRQGKKEIDGSSRDQTTTQRLGSMTNLCRSRRRTISTLTVRQTALKPSWNLVPW